MKGHMQDGKFHPHTEYKGIRKSRDQIEKTEGVKIRKQRLVAEGRDTKKHISPRLILAIDNLQRTLDRGLKDTRYNGTMEYWSELKYEADLVSSLIQKENVENEIVTAVPQDVINETLRMKRDGREDVKPSEVLGVGNKMIGGTQEGEDMDIETRKILAKKVSDEYRRIVRLNIGGVGKLEFDKIDRWMLSGEIVVVGGMLAGDIVNLDNAGWNIRSIQPSSKSKGDLVVSFDVNRQEYRK